MTDVFTVRPLHEILGQAVVVPCLHTWDDLLLEEDVEPPLYQCARGSSKVPRLGLRLRPFFGIPA